MLAISTGRSGLIRLFLFLSALFFAASPCAYPANTTVLQGKITDFSNGKPVAAAIVSLEGFPLFRKRINVSTASDSRGAYRIEALLPSGIYKVECGGQGYRKYSGFLKVISGRSHRRDIRLVPQRKPPNRAPVIRSVLPEDGSEILCGAKTCISICAFDPEGGLLEYRFLVKQNVIRGWSRDPVYSWQSPEEAAEEFSIICQARDRAGLIGEKTVRYRLFKPSAAELLEKVKSNYAGISDFSAQMRFESHTGLPDGDTLKYCRYYFMAPDKERTDTYARPSATGLPEETLILNGGQLIFISGSQRQEVDLQQEFADSGTDIGLLNVCYATDDFLAGHEIDLNLQMSSADKLIFALEARPVKETALYRKILLRVDYRRGVVTGYDIYTPGESGEGSKLWQSIRTEKVREFPGKIFLPAAVKKTIYLKGGEISSSISYTHVRLNSGLSEEKFE